jgi:DNA-binding SARP family transcriptional activator
MLASARRTVSRAELIDGLWGQDPPASAKNSVHVHIAALRRVLEPRRAQIERARLDELRQVATEDRVDLMLMLGAHHELLPDLAALIHQHPLRERFRGQLMLAQYRCGRQAEALAAFDDARRDLAAQLGIDPGPALRHIHARILAADPSLRPSRLGARAAWRTSDLGWACHG